MTTAKVKTILERLFRKGGSKYKKLLSLETKEFYAFVINSEHLLKEEFREVTANMNRALAFYYAKKGIPVIPNIRWTNEKSYEFCFLGIPKKYIVSISTHGCCKSRQQKEDFKKGLSKMLEVLEPTDVIVHGCMPKSIFEEFESRTRFHRFPSEFEMTHKKEV